MIADPFLRILNQSSIFQTSSGCPMGDASLDICATYKAVCFKVALPSIVDCCYYCCCCVMLKNLFKTKPLKQLVIPSILDTNYIQSENLKKRTSHHKECLEKPGHEAKPIYNQKKGASRGKTIIRHKII